MLTGYGRDKTLFLDMHLDQADDNWTLADIEGLANRCVAWTEG